MISENAWCRQLFPENDKDLFQGWLSRWEPVSGQGLWSRDQIQKHFFSEGVMAFGCGFADEPMIALVLGRKSGALLDIDFLATLTAGRLSGAMSYLIDHIVKILRFETLWLEVHEENQGALAFYRRMGFSKVGVRNNYYLDGKGGILLEWRAPGF